MLAQEVAGSPHAYGESLSEADFAAEIVGKEVHYKTAQVAALAEDDPSSGFVVSAGVATFDQTTGVRDVSGTGSDRGAMSGASRSCSPAAGRRRFRGRTRLHADGIAEVDLLTVDRE